MGIWNRLGSVINSYINDFGEQTNSRLKTSGYFSRGGYSRSDFNQSDSSRSGFSRSDFSRNDPDLDAAYEELDDYLNRPGNDSRAEKKRPYSEASSAAGQKKSAGVKPPPLELREDFELLKVPFGADEETCKAAYKKLLKLHHPDRHAGHEGNYKKATEKMSKINAAWDRIEKYHQEKK